MSLIERLGKTRKAMIKSLGEYFLGTETFRFYKDERAFFREYILDSDRLKGELRESQIQETFELLIGKIIPNLISLYAIGKYSYLKDSFFLYLILLGESCRLLGISAIKHSKKYRENLRQSVTEEAEKEDYEHKRLKDSLQGLCEKIDEEESDENDKSEEWKNR